MIEESNDESIAFFSSSSRNVLLRSDDIEAFSQRAGSGLLDLQLLCRFLFLFSTAINANDIITIADVVTIPVAVRSSFESDSDATEGSMPERTASIYTDGGIDGVIIKVGAPSDLLRDVGIMVGTDGGILMFSWGPILGALLSN